MKKKDSLDEHMDGAFAQAKQGLDLLKDPKIKLATAEAVVSGKADEALGKKTSLKTKEKILKNLDSPKRQKKIINNKNSKKSKISDDFTGALMHFLPMVVGGALGGTEGAIGAQEGFNASLERDRKAQLQERDMQLKEQGAEDASQLASLQIQDAQRLADERASGREGLTRKEEALFKLQEGSLRVRDSATRAKLIQEHMKNNPPLQQQFRDLPAEKTKVISNVAMASDAISEAFDAFNKGNNTFEFVGQDEFTFAAERFKEAFGRLQSGGAITKDEEAAFLSLLPTPGDSRQVQKEKMIKMNREMQRRVRFTGFSPEDLGLRTNNIPGLTDGEINQLRQQPGMKEQAQAILAKRGLLQGNN